MTEVKKEVKKVKEVKSYQDKEWLLANYGSGEGRQSAGAIAREFEVTRTVILYFLRKFDIKITTRTSIPKKKIAEKQIAEKQTVETPAETSASFPAPRKAKKKAAKKSATKPAVKK